jgi:hypothetical protein
VACVLLSLVLALCLWRSIATLLDCLWSLHRNTLTDAGAAYQRGTFVELLIGWPVIIAAKTVALVQLTHLFTLLM